MTYREYLNQVTDEMERAIIIVNLARQCPNYDSYTPLGKKRALNRLLNQEMPGTVKINKTQKKAPVRANVSKCCAKCVNAEDYTGYDDFYCSAYNSWIRAERYNCKQFKS